MYRATEQVVTKRVALSESLQWYQDRWLGARPESESPVDPDLRIAAYVIAVERCRLASEQRGVWP